MKITVKSKYLVFPVNTLASKKQLCFSENGKDLYCLNIKYDAENPNFYAYIEMTRFLGRELEMTVKAKPCHEFCPTFREADCIDTENLYHEPLRPFVHFTPKNGWINDPNGLIFHDGIYHMFYQYNPTEPHWDNMHWGHAVSRDLLHWEEVDVALYPDERGTMFSGCAIADERNLLGLQVGDTPTALLYYTVTEPFSQWLSYSTDGFKTIHRYKDAPRIENFVGANRDPKVIFCEELDAYVMVLYASHDEPNDFRIFTSPDLVNWKCIQSFHIDGDTEVPDILPFRDEDGSRKYILTGAHDRYIVCEVRDGKFVEIQKTRGVQIGNTAQAVQTVSGAPDGRLLRMVWDIWGFDFENAPFNGQIGLPLEYRVEKEDGVYYLAALPAPEVSALCKESRTWDAALSPEAPLHIDCEESAYILELTGEFDGHTELRLFLFGREIILNLAENKFHMLGRWGDIRTTNGKLRVTAVIDRCSTELYYDGGRIYTVVAGTNGMCDFTLPCIDITASHPYSLNVKLHRLNSIHE